MNLILKKIPIPHFLNFTKRELISNSYILEIENTSKINTLMRVEFIQNRIYLVKVLKSYHVSLGYINHPMYLGQYDEYIQSNGEDTEND